MRRLFVLLMVLLCSLQLVSSDLSFQLSQDCCDKLTTVKIPLRRITSYWWTSSSCAKRAVVFKTSKGQRCVDASASWVNGHIAALDKRQASAATVRTNTANPMMTVGRHRS
ncbi:monocyte chemotactic protein 1B-like [Hoplias malabaricus]|uniref:monocyte chemotactic protein 1B-like n=1 Tax=Hoplias malabaricus TaxID=27720 RepID=UPI0034621DE8